MKNNNKIPVILFAAYFLAVLGIFFSRPFELKTDIMDIIPQSGENSKIKEEALKNLSKEYTAKINVLFGNEDLNRAKEAGMFFEELLKNEDLNIRFIIEQDKNAVIDLMSQYNYHLLSARTFDDLEHEKYGKVSGRALSFAYGAVNAGLLPFDKDPFFLAPDFMMNLGLTKSGFFPNQGVLSAKTDNLNYAYMMININHDKAFSPAYLIPAVKKINDAGKAAKMMFSDVEVNISGVPVHSYHATSNSIYEMNIISIVSILSILIVSYAAFKSANCFFYALFTIAVSFAAAFAVTCILFGSIHVLVLVFGASLIGLCIDYHIHYFSERPYSGNSYTTLDNIKKAIRISLITSLTGFVVMMFSGIGIISHMAVFAIAGLANAYVIIRFLYPVILKNTKIGKIPNYIIKFEKSCADTISNMFKKHFHAKVFIIITVFGAGIFMIKPSDGIKDLYKPNPKLLEAEILFAKISDMGSAPVMYIVQGGSEQEALSNEEEARIFLDELESKEAISGYKSITQIIPSIKKQQNNYKLVEALFSKEFEKYADDLGIGEEKRNVISRNFTSQKNQFATLNDIGKYDILKNLNGLFIKDKDFASIILIENAKDKEALIRYAQIKNGVTYSDKIAEMSEILKHCRERASISLLATIVIIFVFMAVYYKGFKKAAAVIIPSIISITATLGIMGYMGINISLFHILALFLIVCFGVDYSIFRVETKDKIKHSGVAVMISCITTLASFGTLAFTSFAVTKALGLTLSLGIFLSYLLSPLATINLSKNAEN